MQSVGQSGQVEIQNEDITQIQKNLIEFIEQEQNSGKINEEKSKQEEKKAQLFAKSFLKLNENELERSKENEEQNQELSDYSLIHSTDKEVLQITMDEESEKNQFTFRKEGKSIFNEASQGQIPEFVVQNSETNEYRSQETTKGNIEKSESLKSNQQEQVNEENRLD